MNERRAKETGEAMHLHRNSVVYRIEHLCEAARLGDPDDPNVRTGLLMSLLMYNLCGNDE
ncbi:MAG: helix-turn-helix domain-containing protein [Oscillospiraceae bacterium]|nr:helix-turn-helix domain-containing protein [Oscillospiraceae bacterium]